MTHQIYSVPEDLLTTTIGLEIRPPGGKWECVPLIVTYSMSEQPHANGGAEAHASIGISGAVEIRATFPESVNQVAARPSMRNALETRVSGNTIEATIAEPRYLTFEVNHENPDGSQSDAPHYTLYLLFDAIDPNAPTADTPGVVVFEPGRHEPEDFSREGAVLLLLPGVHDVIDQKIFLRNNSTLYLSGGAHLRSYVHAIKAENLSIMGPGVIDGSNVPNKTREWRDDGDSAFVLIREGRNIRFDGPVIYDSPFWNLTLHGGSQIHIRRYKSICWKVNNDGIQPRNCENLLVEDCFLKCADDCVAIKSRRTAKMSYSNQIYRRLICWNDLPGNAVEIGHTSQADELQNVIFDSIDVIHGECLNEQKFVISIFLVDHCDVHDVTYRGFRVEGYKTLGEFGIQIAESRYSTDSKRGRISRITVTDYQQDTPLIESSIKGFGTEHLVSKVHFEGIYFTDTQNDGLKQLAVMDELNLKTHYAEAITLA